MSGADKGEEAANANTETNERERPEPCGRRRKFYGMIGVASVVCLGILFFVALGFFFHYYGENPTRALWWGVASAFFAILGVGFYVQQFVIWAPNPKQRPHVFFTLARLKKPLTVGEKVVVQIALKNSAPTEEAWVKFWDNTYYFNVAPFKDSFEYIPSASSSFHLAPGADMNGELRFNFVITKEKLEALHADEAKARLFFFARGEYRDGLGQPYPLSFCRMYDKDIGGNLIFCPDSIRLNESVSQTPPTNSPTNSTTPSSTADRAVVAVQGANFTVFEVNKHTEALVTFVNSGRLLATNVRVYGHIDLRDKPLDPDMPGAKDIGEEPSQGILEPNGGTIIMPIYSGGPLTPSLMALIDKGSHRVYIWGIVTYEDAIGEHWTKFCMIQYRKTMNLENCTNNNEADK